MFGDKYEVNPEMEEKQLDDLLEPDHKSKSS